MLHVIAALVAFIAADHLRSLLQQDFASSDVRSIVLASIAVYVVVFAAAGAVMALVTDRRQLALALALLVGVASPLSTLPFESMHPFIHVTHAPMWLVPFLWANWYVPPAAALLGALVVLGARARTRRPKPPRNQPT